MDRWTKNSKNLFNFYRLIKFLFSIKSIFILTIFLIWFTTCLISDKVTPWFISRLIAILISIKFFVNKLF